MPDFNFNNDSISKSDTIIYDLAESALKSEVKYHADDSVLYDINNELIFDQGIRYKRLLRKYYWQPCF